MSKAYPCVYCTDDRKCTRWPDEAMNFCVLGPCEYEKPSNGDRIRAKSDEELAEWLCHGCCPSDRGGTDIADEYCSDTNCRECWLEWLKKEADNG